MKKVPACCENCDASGTAVVFCQNCPGFLCETCNNRIHIPKIRNSHTRISVVKYNEIMEILDPRKGSENSFPSGPNLSNEFLKLDEENNTVHLGEGFRIFQNREDNVIPIVSFVGSVGKSTLVKFLCAIEPGSYVGKMTGSVNSYYRKLYPQENIFLILDPDGLRSESLKESVFQIQYRISSVICLLYYGSVRDKGTLMAMLNTLANASKGTVNEGPKPALVIVLNNSTECGALIAFNNWLGLENEIRINFSNPKAVFIPDLISNLGNCDRIISNFRETIESQVKYSLVYGARGKNDVCHLLKDILQD